MTPPRFSLQAVPMACVTIVTVVTIVALTFLAADSRIDGPAVMTAILAIGASHVGVATAVPYVSPTSPVTPATATPSPDPAIQQMATAQGDRTPGS